MGYVMGAWHLFTFPCTFTRIPAIATGYTTLKLPTEDNDLSVDNVVSQSIAFEIPASPSWLILYGWYAWIEEFEVSSLDFIQ